MYSTDLTDAQWNNIKDYLDKAGRKSKFSVCSIWERADVYSENGGGNGRCYPKRFPNGISVLLLS